MEKIKQVFKRAVREVREASKLPEAAFDYNSLTASEIIDLDRLYRRYYLKVWANELLAEVEAGTVDKTDTLCSHLSKWIVKNHGRMKRTHIAAYGPETYLGTMRDGLTATLKVILRSRYGSDIYPFNQYTHEAAVEITTGTTWENPKRLEALNYLAKEWNHAV